jgi:hypothetical protein
VSFVGSAGSSFIKAFMQARVHISITLSGIQGNPNTQVTCREDLAKLLLNEWNLWMQHVLG